MIVSILIVIGIATVLSGFITLGSIVREALLNRKLQRKIAELESAYSSHAVLWAKHKYWASL
jgi:hypothetical protein